MKRRAPFKIPSTIHKTNPSANAIASKQTELEQSEKPLRVFSILWRKITFKKHKTWEGDGILVIQGNQCSIHNLDGERLGGSSIRGIDFSIGSVVRVSGKEISLENTITEEEYFKGSFLNTTVSIEPVKPEKKLNTAFVMPLSKEGQEKLHKKKLPVARHDPNAPDALVMERMQPWDEMRNVDVVIDPRLAKILQPHQKEGVSFLYNCLMSIGRHNSYGAILADEMGLGKTLQTITVLWTLLKQNPIANAAPPLKKIMIVSPVTLLQNWKNEFIKWLGTERIHVMIAKSTVEFKEFIGNVSYSVVLVGYEKVRSFLQDNIDCDKIDLVVCDEGHRLKSMNSQTGIALQKLKTKRRLLLTGTPIQNDLMEFYAMVNFIMPGVLGSQTSFRSQYELPILRSRLVNASTKNVLLGNARLERLARYASTFVLRRKIDVLSETLPPRTDVTIFLKPSRSQELLYEEHLDKFWKDRTLENEKTFPLSTLTELNCLCNSTRLIQHQENTDLSLNDLIASSSKFEFLKSLLLEFKNSQLKCVIVSQFTETLNLIEILLKHLLITHCRLDGSTPTNTRQSLVDQFNCSTYEHLSVFLLSNKSGGAGLNLVGANRLILFEPSWNPAYDLQALGRIYRYGQNRSVLIYTLLSTGMLDEQIYIRQHTKTGLSNAFMDSDTSTLKYKFQMKDMKNLFSYHKPKTCLMHELITKTASVLTENNSKRINHCKNEDMNDSTNNNVLENKEDEYKKEWRPARLLNENLSENTLEPIVLLEGWNHYNLSDEGVHSSKEIKWIPKDSMHLCAYVLAKTLKSTKSSGSE
ncbi:ATP-dependent DNA helicase Rdh54 [Schizosaccharomyces japonicus yFS275]|uniref:ATP-dependent DNA helicase Rdh54 n=1 Tax=Schizosaccharomyces japonicus (strain yFS275 / FY16936) TaxID=402676 RepID=B6JX52_SCHJY|nr:ATP-dependent DNA helicase Rdh54 [Schizosaccharomyces japonicus yFS275]EEB05953.2 ATP-dependent DNA helicase Rdh54 [Schizosaccharomyces japonicus yFS275]